MASSTCGPVPDPTSAGATYDLRALARSGADYAVRADYGASTYVLQFCAAALAAPPAACARTGVLVCAQTPADTGAWESAGETPTTLRVLEPGQLEMSYAEAPGTNLTTVVHFSCEPSYTAEPLIFVVSPYKSVNAPVPSHVFLVRRAIDAPLVPWRYSPVQITVITAHACSIPAPPVDPAPTGLSPGGVAALVLVPILLVIAGVFFWRWKSGKTGNPFAVKYQPV